MTATHQHHPSKHSGTGRGDVHIARRGKAAPTQPPSAFSSPFQITTALPQSTVAEDVPGLCDGAPRRPLSLFTILNSLFLASLLLLATLTLSGCSVFILSSRTTESDIFNGNPTLAALENHLGPPLEKQILPLPLSPYDLSHQIEITTGKKVRRIYRYSSSTAPIVSCLTYKTEGRIVPSQVHGETLFISGATWTLAEPILIPFSLLYISTGSSIQNTFQIYYDAQDLPQLYIWTRNYPNSTSTF